MQEYSNLLLIVKWIIIHYHSRSPFALGCSRGSLCTNLGTLPEQRPHLRTSRATDGDHHRCSCRQLQDGRTEPLGDSIHPRSAPQRGSPSTGGPTVLLFPLSKHRGREHHISEVYWAVLAEKGLIVGRFNCKGLHQLHNSSFIVKAFHY